MIKVAVRERFAEGDFEEGNDVELLITELSTSAFSRGCAIASLFHVGRAIALAEVTEMHAILSKKCIKLHIVIGDAKVDR